MVNYYSSYERQMRTFVNDKENIFDGISKELQKDKLLALVKSDFNETYNNIEFINNWHVINILNNYREKMKKHLDFVYNIIHDKKSDNYTVRIFFNEEIIKFDEIIENFYKKNKENKKLFTESKYFQRNVSYVMTLEI